MSRPQRTICSAQMPPYRWMGLRSDLELETLFGIKQGRSHGYFPASAFRGPFLPLLRYHPRQGLGFILSVFNHCTDWYAHPAGSIGICRTARRDDANLAGWHVEDALVQRSALGSLPRNFGRSLCFTVPPHGTGAVAARIC